MALDWKLPVRPTEKSRIQERKLRSKLRNVVWRGHSCPRMQLHSALVSCHYGLPQTESTIAGGHFILRKDLEFGTQKGFDQSSGEVQVVEGAAAQADTVERGAITQSFRDVHKNVY